MSYSMSKTSFFLLIILIWLQYSLWFGKNGIFDFIRVYNVLKFSNDNNNGTDYMKTRNDQLLLEIHDLIYGYEAIEEHARYNLGMIKADEVFYQIKSNS